MRAAQKAKQVARIAHRLEYLHGGTAQEWQDAAARTFRVISRVSHAVIQGDQGKTAKSRTEADALVVAMVTEALKVL